MKGDSTSKRPRVGLVLSAGGARGAYEVGVLRYIRERLRVDTQFDVITGSSIANSVAAMPRVSQANPGVCIFEGGAFIMTPPRLRRLFCCFSKMVRSGIYMSRIAGVSRRRHSKR